MSRLPQNPDGRRRSLPESQASKRQWQWAQAEVETRFASTSWLAATLAELEPLAEVRGEQLIERALAARLSIPEPMLTAADLANGSIEIEGRVRLDDTSLIRRQLAGLDGDPDEDQHRSAEYEALRQKQRMGQLAPVQPARLKEVCPQGHSMDDALVTIEKRRGGIAYRRCRTCLKERYQAKRALRKTAV